MLSRVAWVTMLACVVLLAVEFTVRVEDLLQYGISLRSPYRSQSELVVRDSLGIHGRPAAAFEKWRLNSLGLRGPEAAVEKETGTRRVIVLGASETFGLYESPDREYPRELQAILNSPAEAESCPNRAGTRWEVLNAAFPGMTLPTAAQDFRMRLMRLRPDIVVIYPTPVQYLDARVPAASPPESGSPGAPPPSPFRPRSLNRLRSSFKSLAPEALLDQLRGILVTRDRGKFNAAATFSSVPQERLDAFRRGLDSLVMLASAGGAEVVVVAHVSAFLGNAERDGVLSRSWQRFYPLASPRVIIDFDSIARGISREVAESSGAEFIDPVLIFSSNPESLFADASHFNDAGAHALADTIAKHISAKLTSERCLPVPSK